MSALTTAEVLRDAKAVLERNGWFQGHLYDPDQATAGTPRSGCRVCLVGAFTVAATGYPGGRSAQCDAAWEAVLGTLKQRGLVPDDAWDAVVADWNDEPGRTLAEVYTLLDEAIERAEAVGQS